jgi:hypothetical protein
VNLRYGHLTYQAALSHAAKITSRMRSNNIPDSISSVKDFLERAWVTPLQSDTQVTLFRGQLQDLPLLPKLFRSPNTPKKVEMFEPAILQRLKNIASHLRPSQPKNDWDWLSLGQHYGMSTRMSDWSANPLVALFFSVEMDAAEGANPLVYRYPIPRNIIEINKEGSPLNIPHTRVIQPGGHSHRSEAQAAWHIVHAIHRENGVGEPKFIPLANMPRHNKLITKIPICNVSVPSIRSELLQMGVSHSTVYGDYQSVCRSIAPGFGLAYLPH